MKSQGKPIMVIALIAVIVVALSILAWQLLSAGSDEIPQSVYPQPLEGQPTVEQVGPPPDVVPATTSGTPFKGR